ncbi:neuraminidase-like domain-containing protein [Pseudomonas sp. SR18]|uniref:Tc toxin subunit A-related protein n=1 Tax=Pseudomonas sp. SR18 TaxID=1461074 RepID=UPI00203326E7|nr:neuraminidase-like domain-containing protein [Pseudomonas sp. SR18]MCM2360535.1 neuraminidase-like domain-containing protein [Pseudomonas sp. SR18]
MSHVLNQRLNESLRDAMLAYYLAHTIPAAQKGKINNPDDLYEYWLLDVQVSQAVPTSPVACAIASLQQYITRIQLGLEPGYEKQGMTAQQDQVWREQLHAYPLWSASQQLRYHPANYLDPTLRRNKTDSFQQLENDLSQYRLQPDTVLTAVQSYLGRFEEMANIRTLNGYIDGNASELHTSRYYFVGKSTSEKAYYWRSLDLSKRSPSNPLKPSIQAWSDWKKINLTLSDDTVEQSIRPVFLNNRLYLIWAECVKPEPTRNFKTPGNKDDDDNHLDEWLNSHYVRFRLNYSYKKYDDSWSVPLACINQHCATEEVNACTAAFLKAVTQTVAIVDADSPATLFLGLHVPMRKDPKQQDSFTGKFFQAVHLDPHFNITKVADGGSPERYKVLPGSELSEEISRLLEAFDFNQRETVQNVLRGEASDHNGYYSELLPDTARQYFTYFGYINKGNLQFKIAPYTQRHVTIKHQHAPFSEKDNWNFENKQRHIDEVVAGSPTFDSNTNKLIITSTLKDNFRQNYSVTLTKEGITLTLMTQSSLDDPKAMQLELGEGSAITGPAETLKTDFYALYFRNSLTHEEFPNFVHDKDKLLITADTTPAPNESISLAGKFIDKSAFVHLFTHAHTPMHVSLNRYGIYAEPQTGLHLQNALKLTNVDVTTSPLRAYKHIIMSANFDDYPLTDTIDANSNRILNFQDTAHDSLAGSSPELPAGHRVTAHIPVPDSTESLITLIHGVLTLRPSEDGPQILGYALKAVTINVAAAIPGAAPVRQRAPTITRLSSDALGTAEFIDFSASTLIKDPLAAIRLNTCFAGKLAEAANISLERLFSLTPKQWQEPPLTANGPPQDVDFQGANGKYFWELFLYLPWLVAHRLNHEQQYVEALAWLNYIFDPGRSADAASDRPAYWGFRELTRHDQATGEASADPHQLALAAPVHLRKAVYQFYLDILLNRGDAAYRQLTADSLTQAKLWYTRVNQLLEARPRITQVEPWASITLDALAKSQSTALRRLEWQSPHIDENLAVDGCSLPLLTDTDNLCLPFNPELVARWDKLESRLHNLRHNLDISGKPLRLALYATPLSPQRLLVSQAKGAPDQDSLASLTPAPSTHYRFQVMLSHAREATETLIQFGNTMLSLNERKEQAELLELQQQQAWDLANIIVSQQQQAVLLDEKNRQALAAGRRVIEQRAHYYERQLAEGVSGAEAQAGLLHLRSAGFEAAAAIAGAAAGVAMLAPNIVGTSVGGSRWEGPFHAAQAVAQGAAGAMRSSAADLDRTEQFNRRAQEWTLARDQAHLELAQIDVQQQAYAEQEKATRLQLRLAETSLAQAWSSYQLLTKRFAKARLYDWLNVQLGQFFYQAYDLCLSLCQAAEACWQYEMADFEHTFIRPGAWNNSYRGYLAGEALKLSLLNMNRDYLSHHVRDLEIVKTLSLRDRLSECEVNSFGATQPVDTRDPWSLHKGNLVEKGTLGFKLTKALFDQDYPGHVLRRIKSISVSLPAILGPYQDIRALLTQTGNEIELPNGVSRKDVRAHQQIALSTGLDDNGLFTLMFEGNDRYLPFEYTGAISNWTLMFPEPARQKAMLESINDIVIHVRYTARATGKGERL